MAAASTASWNRSGSSRRADPPASSRTTICIGMSRHLITVSSAMEPSSGDGRPRPGRRGGGMHRALDDEGAGGSTNGEVASPATELLSTSRVRARDPRRRRHGLTPYASRVKMHDDQVDVDADIVRQLLTDQRPDLARLPITPVVSTGTVNALFRIGEDLVARLPLQHQWAEGIDREWRWIPWLSSRISSVRPAGTRLQRHAERRVPVRL